VVFHGGLIFEVASIKSYELIYGPICQGNIRFLGTLFGKFSIPIFILADRQLYGRDELQGLTRDTFDIAEPLSQLFDARLGLFCHFCVIILVVQPSGSHPRICKRCIRRIFAGYPWKPPGRTHINFWRVSGTGGGASSTAFLA